MTNLVRSVRGTATLISIIVGIFITAVIGWFAIILPWLARLEREENIAFLNNLATIVIGYNYPIVGKMADGVQTIYESVKEGKNLAYERDKSSAGHYFTWSSPEEILVFFRTNLDVYNEVISSVVRTAEVSSAEDPIRFTSNPADIFTIACDQRKNWRLASYDKSLIFSNFVVTLEGQELPRNEICSALQEGAQLTFHNNSQAWPIFVFVRYRGVLQDLLSSLVLNSNYPNVAVIPIYPRLQIVGRNEPLNVLTRVFLTVFATNWPEFNPQIASNIRLNKNCLHPVIYSYFNVTARLLFFLNLLFNVEDTRFLGYFSARSSEIGLHPVELSSDLPPFSLVLEEEGQETCNLIFTGELAQDLSDLSGVTIYSQLPQRTISTSNCFHQLESFGGLLLPTANLSTLLSVSPSEVREFFGTTKANLVFLGPTIRIIDDSQASSVMVSESTSFNTRLQLNQQGNRLVLTASQGFSFEPPTGGLMIDAFLLTAYADEQQVFPELDTIVPFSPHSSYFLLKFFPLRFQLAQPSKTFHTASFPNFVNERVPEHNPDDQPNNQHFFYSRFTNNLSRILNLCGSGQALAWLNEKLEGINSNCGTCDSCQNNEISFLLDLEKSFNEIAWSVLVNHFGLVLKP